MMRSLVHTGVFLLVALSLPPAIRAQASSIGDCAELQSGDLGNITAPSPIGLLADTLRIANEDIDGSGSGDGSGSDDTVNDLYVQILESNVVCLSQGSVKNTYSTVSVVVRYTADGIESTSQVEYECSRTDSGPVWGVSNPVVVNDSLVAATLTTPMRTDCSRCINPIAAGPTSNITGVEHCSVCESCNDGLMRCTGVISNQTCCSYFDMAGSCVTTCPANSSPDGNFDCVCDPGYTARGSSCQSIFFPYGVASGDQVLFGNSYPQIGQIEKPENITCPFFGVQQDTIYVNTHGALSFGRPFYDYYAPVPFPNQNYYSTPLIAPLLADSYIYTQFDGEVFYRYTDNETLMNEVTSCIDDAFDSGFYPAVLFIVTWNTRSSSHYYYGIQETVNTFQAVIATDGEMTFVLFLYGDINIPVDRYYGIVNARIGFDSGTGIGYNLPQDDLNSIRDLVRLSNIERPGIFAFRVDQGSGILLSPKFSVRLNVLNPVENILEPDDGEYVIVTQCISAQLDYPRDRDAEFEFNISDASTAEVDYDFNPAPSQRIIIPANFSGYFSVCLNTSVFGNDRFNGIRKIVYSVTAVLSIYDTVTETNPVINILENDGVLFPYGETFGDQVLNGPIGVDQTQKPLNISCPFFGIQQDTIYVSTAGVLSLGGSLYRSSSSVPVVAPFYAESEVGGEVFYRYTDNETLLDEVTSYIDDAFDSGFYPAVLFIATWNRVVEYAGDSQNVVNTFQIVIASDGEMTFVLFLYGDIQWYSSVSTLIGFYSGTGISYSFPQEILNNLLNLESLSNIEHPGIFAFRVDQDSGILLSPKFGVSLNVLNPVENILEPDDGEYVIVNQCVSAQLDYPLDRDAEFEFNISDTSTAEVGYDFDITSQNITIPTNFSGYFSVCLNTTVFGNDIFDGIRKIVYTITPLSVYDIATDMPVINILENDGVLFPYGEAFGDQVLTGRISFHYTENRFSWPFFGINRYTIYVGTDLGYVSFGEYQYFSWVFYAEFDTSLSGGLFYRYTVNETLLDEIASCINDVFDNDVEFYPTVLFIATWNRMVALYGDNQKVNTFQVVMATDEEMTYVLFLYGDIQWSRSVFYYEATRIGFGTYPGRGGISYNLPQADSDDTILDLANLTNIGRPGIFAFRVDQESIILPPNVTITPSKNLSVLLGDYISLNCSPVVQSSEDLTYTWTHLDRTLEENSSILTLSSVSTEELGTYSCNIDSPSSSDSAQVTITSARPVIDAGVYSAISTTSCLSFQQAQEEAIVDVLQLLTDQYGVRPLGLSRSYSAESCDQVAEANPDSMSGLYWISNGEDPVQLQCNF